MRNWRLFMACAMQQLAYGLTVLLFMSGSLASAEDGAKSLKWLTTRAEGLRDAQAQNRPMLVRFSAEWCSWCKRLDEEIEKPAVQEVLKNWTLVEIDLDHNPRDAQALRVDGIPALRVIAPTGRLVASRDGYLTDDKLIEWLKKSFDQATEAPEESLFGSGPPTPLELRKIVRQLSERDASLREAAVRRLIPHPAESAELIVQVLKQEKLAAQLAALELLREWEAPIEQIDPWQPDSITPERLGRFTEWLAKVSTDEKAPRVLSPEELEEVRTELKRMLTADPENVQSIRERLARYKQALLSEVVSLLAQTTEDEQHSRLLAMRYRLVMTDDIAVKTPGLVTRLAAVDPRTRQDAVRELTEQATSKTEPLFLELFADPDPLVRELSLLGLRSASGDEGQTALVKLLDDPDPNVRAAVLKVFAEDPWMGLQDRLIQYLKTEQDTGLLVHAVRCFRKMNVRSPELLLPLTKHRDWQVRAEMIDTMTGGWQRYPDDRSKKWMQSQEVQDAIAECLNDEDAFVVSRAMLAYKNGVTKKVVKKLLAVPARHPSLAYPVVQTLKSATNFKDEIEPDFKEFFLSKDPVMRAAAIQGLGVMDPEGIQPELLAAFADEDVEVRLAGAKTLQAILKSIQNQSLPKNSSGNNILIDDSEDGDEIIINSINQDGAALNALTVEVDPDNVIEPKMAKKADSDDSSQPDADVAMEEEQAKKDDATAPRGRSTGSGGLLGLIKSIVVGSAPPPPPAQAVPLSPSQISQRSQQPHSVSASKRGKQRDLWLQKFEKGEKRPEWMATMIPPLVKMFESKDTSERIASLVPLVALGEYARVQPELLTLARKAGPLSTQIVPVLDWLPFAERQPLVQEFMDLPDSKDLNYAVVNSISNWEDIRDSDAIWKFLQSPQTAPDQAGYIIHNLRRLYFGQNYYNLQQLPATYKSRIHQKLVDQLSRPPGWNHIVALVIMNDLKAVADDELKPKMREAAQLIVDNDQLEPDLRADAFQISLILMEKSARQKKLLEMLQSGVQSQQVLALKILLEIDGGLTIMPKSHIAFNEHSIIMSNGQNANEAIEPEPPEGVEADMVRPLLTDADPELRAMAGYILAVSEDSTGMEPLLMYWQTKARGNDDWRRLVYRAIAATDDSSRIPILMQIYKDLEEWRVREFYWTIRIMTGPKILEFRQRIRKEHPNNLGN